jgi:GntR family transcriptional regulator/MocR family aminotransferase
VRASPQQLVTLPAAKGHLYLQIYHRMRGLILSGAWDSNMRLPSSRMLASDLGVSRNTALLAIERLTSDGWIVARPGSGIYVSDEAPRIRASRPSHAQPIAHHFARPVPFQLGAAGADLFPVATWRKIQSQVWSQASNEALYETCGPGWGPLREEVAGYLHAVRGLCCDPEQVLIVPSTEVAIDLSMRMLAKAGDEIWVEDPTDPKIGQVIRPHGLRQCPIPVDADGFRVETALGTFPEARFAYVTPTCQFPTGAVLSDGRRAQLLDWARRRQSFVIEDDAEFNAVFDGRVPVAPLAADNRENVLFIHSFNRILFPALKVAALVVPPRLVDRFVAESEALGSHPDAANQIVLAEFIRKGFLSSHLRQCRATLADRRTAMQEAIRYQLADWVAIDPGQNGFHLVASSPKLGDRELAAIAARGGLRIESLSGMTARAPAGRQAALIGFGAYSEDVIRENVELLADLLATETRRERRAAHG